MRVFTGRREWLAQEGLRLDATTYGVGGLEARDRVLESGFHWRRLTDLANVFYEARFARVYVQDPEHGKAYVTGSDMLLSDLQGLLRLSLRLTPQLPSLLLQEGWTLLSRSGTIGRVAYVRGEMAGMAASDDVIRIVPNKDEVRSGYLFAFLSSPRAQAMIQQKTYGSVVQHIEPHHIADMPVPLAGNEFQRHIHDLVTRAAAARTESTRLLDVASAHFDAKAGRLPSLHEHAFAADSVPRSALGTRLDAFHHIGWAAEAVKEGDRLGEIADVTVPGRMKLTHAEYGAAFYTGIDVYQVRPNALKCIARWLPGFADLAVAPGTVLMQVDGQRYGLMGRPAYAGRRMAGAAVSWHMARIQGDQAARIFAFARSEVGRRAIVGQSFGTSVPSITARLLAAVRIPPLPEALVTGASHALRLREQADADEEQAIQEVEAWLG